MKKIAVILAMVAMVFFIDACSSTRSTGSTGNSGTGTTSTGTNTAGENVGSTTTGASVNREFVDNAASGGMMEVELGTIALERASSQEVKDLARHIMDDHTKANEQLKSIAAKENIPVPGVLKDDQRDNIDKLSKLSGSDFDKEYVDLMVKDHKDDIKEFEDMAQNAQSPGLKAFAQQTLPVLKDHLQMAQTVQSKLEK
ncbi:MAG: DUF4142 domain-containing protein [Ignavibacteriales bacterium]